MSLAIAAHVVHADAPEAVKLLRSGRAVTLGVEPQVVLETLSRFGWLRFVLANGAARVVHAGKVESVAAGEDGATVSLGSGTELWLFPRQLRLALAVAEPAAHACPLSLRFFDGAGHSVLEIHAARKSQAADRFPRCIERWLSKGPRVFKPERAPRDLERDVLSRPGLSTALGAAHNHGDVETMRSLSARHGLSRLDALALVGSPWARRLRSPRLAGRLRQLSARRLSVRFLVGNQGATYVRTGPLGGVHIHGGAVMLRDTGSSAEITQSAVESLWSVRLRNGDQPWSGLESFDRHGEPVLLLSGDPGRAGHESSAWRGFVERQV